MRGPDFEIPPMEPPDPPPELPAHADGNHRSARFAVVAAVVVSLLASAVGALVWFSSQGTTTATPAPQPSTTQTTRALPTSTSSTAVTTTTTVRTVTATQACVDSPETPGAAAGSTPEGFPWITFHASPRAAGEALARIARTASEAREAFGDAGALGVRLYCTVSELATARNTDPGETQREVTEGLVAFMQRGDIWLYGPSFQNRSSVEQRHTVYHEYFHALQRTLSRLRTTRADVDHPYWLMEGSARYFENAVTPSELESFRRNQVRRFERLPALDALETSGQARVIGGTGDAYTVGAVAVDYLVTKYGRDRVQTELWVALAQGDWRSGFERVFEVSVDTFYAEFATYRQTLRP